MALTCDFIAVTGNDSDLTTYNYAGQSLGAAAADRIIYVVVHFGFTSGAGLTLASGTIAGIAATIADQATNTNRCVAIMYAAVPTGTSGTISITASVGALRSSIGVYRVTGQDSTLLDHKNATGTTPVSITPTTVSGGAIIAGVTTQGAAASCTWTNVTEDYDSASGEQPSNQYTAGHATGTSGPSTTVTATITGATNTAMAGVSLSPALGQIIFPMGQAIL